jgi:hypothetical protein
VYGDYGLVDARSPRDLWRPTDCDYGVADVNIATSGAVFGGPSGDEKHGGGFGASVLDRKHPVDCCRCARSIKLVAAMLRPDTFAAQTEPLVNVRFAVAHLVYTGTLSRTDGEAIVQAAAHLHFSERTYPTILAASGLADDIGIAAIITLLKRINLKADDALLLLETLAHAEPKQT